MSTLEEIEAAVELLDELEKQKLLFFVATRLESNITLPPPRDFSEEQIAEWIAEDELAMSKLRGMS